MKPIRARRLHRKGDPYPVLLGRELLSQVGASLRRLWPGRGIAVITQRRVDKLHGARLRRSLERAGVPHVVLHMPEGEEKKNLATVQRLYDSLLRHGITREDALLAFGGGTVGDTAGFVAATFLRGLPYAQLPTTLLAQIDSAIGAKVGVNLPRGKNLVGALYRPSAVFLDPSVLTSLPSREFRSGLFELLKYGFIGARPILRRMETTELRVGAEALEVSITEAVRKKLEIVRVDEGERGPRRVLNFGHTIGHGLEAAGGYRRLRHGEAVGWGMIGAIRIARDASRLDPALALRLESIVRGTGALPPLGMLSMRVVLDAVSRDKKRGSRGLRFVIPVGLGRVEIVERFPLEQIARVLPGLGVETKDRH